MYVSLNTKLIVDLSLSLEICGTFRLFCIIHSPADTPANTKSTANMDKGVVQLNSEVQPLFCWIEIFPGTQKTRLTNWWILIPLMTLMAKQNIMLVSYHFLRSTLRKHVQQPKQPKINGPLKAQAEKQIQPAQAIGIPFMDSMGQKPRALPHTTGWSSRCPHPDAKHDGVPIKLGPVVFRFHMPHSKPAISGSLP